MLKTFILSVLIQFPNGDFQIVEKPVQNLQFCQDNGNYIMREFPNALPISVSYDCKQYVKI